MGKASVLPGRRRRGRMALGALTAFTMTASLVVAVPAKAAPRDEPAGAGEVTAAVEPPEGGLVPSTPDFGWPEGEFSVSDDGAAQYTVPLFTPPGRGGLTPQLSLNYNSRGGNGLLGVGWSLGGVMSRIAPCARTFATDGFRDGVRYGAADALCLDGNRLIQVRPAANGQTEYRTEKETFSRIIGFGPAGAVPTEFTVWSKDGKIQTYGQQNEEIRGALRAHRLRPTADLVNPGLERSSTTRATAAWLLHRIEDRNGNVAMVSYAWSEANAANLWPVQIWPQSIHYSPDRWVRFDLEDRPDKIDGFDGGVHTRTTKRLSTITMGQFAGAESETLRKYTLGYQDPSGSITGRSLLNRITECDPDVCKKPLTFSWSTGSYDFDTIDTPVTDAGTSNDSGHRIITGDIDGNGVDDLFYPDAQNLPQVRFGTGSGFTERRFSGIHRPTPSPIPPYQSQLRPVDYNRDGNLDMMAEVIIPNVIGPTEMALFSGTPGGVFFPYDPDVDEAHQSMSSHPGDPAYFLDLDGNGLPDYATPRQLDADWFPWHYSLNTGQDGAGRFQGLVPTAIERGFKDRIRVLDTTGDGRDEALMLHQAGAGDYRYRTFGLNPQGIVEIRFPNIARPSAATARTFQDLVLADVNGDGLQDAVYVMSGLRVQLNSGNGFGPMIPGPGPDVYHTPPDFVDAAVDIGIRVADFNNDGADDIFVGHVGTPSGPNDHTRGAQLYTWRDDRFHHIPLNRTVAEGNNVGPLAAMQPLDVDGNGVLDLVHKQGDHLRLLKRRGTPPDQLIRIGSGSGPLVEIDYRTMAIGQSDPAVVENVRGCPKVCQTRGGSVVRQHRLTNGQPTDGWNRFLHTYQSPRIDVAGRGWLGFSWHKVAELRTGATTVTEFDNVTHNPFIKAFPFAHLPNKVTHEVTTLSPTPGQPGRTFQRIATNEYDVRRHNDNRTFSVVPKNVAETEQERPANDANAWQTLRTSSYLLGHDEFGNQEATIGGVEQGRGLIETKEFRNNTDAWLIGQLKVHIRADCRAGDCRSRKTTFDYDTNGNPTVTVVEPAKPEFQLTMTTAYGPFGTVDSVTKKDHAGQERKETVEYDAARLYPIATVNAAGHRATVETHRGLGVPLRTTGPNAGEKTTMQYDKFGRLRATHHSDGSFERVDHRVAADGLQRTETTTSAGGFTAVLQDRLGREAARFDRTFDGNLAVTQTHYDIFGRIHRQSRPAFEGQPPQFTTTDYDRRGRVTRVTAPDGIAVRHEYVGRETHTYDGRNIHSYTVATVDGDVGTRFEDDPNSTNWLETVFEYGPSGEVTRTEAPDDTAQVMHYDPLGRRDRLEDPSSGVTTTTYTAFGEVRTETDAENRTSTFDYDLLGRITKVTSPDGEARNTWDTAPNGIGKLTNARSADQIVTEYAYDDVGRAKSATWSIDGTRFAVGYGYDAIGRKSSMTYPAVPGTTDRLKIAYVYNEHGHLAQVKDAAGGLGACTDAERAQGRCFWTAEARNADGQLKRERYGNDVVTENNYKPETGLLDNITATGPGDVGQLNRLLYDYDENRNVEKRHDQINRRWEIYEYDELNRMKRWRTHVPAPGYFQHQADYTYDTIGNLRTESLKLQDKPRRDTTYGYGENGAPPHAMTSRNGMPFGYDRAGRQISGDRRTIAYNADNLPTSMTWAQNQRTEFRYDANGDRVRKQDNELTLISIPGVFERSNPGGTGSTQVHNIHHIAVDGRVVAQVNLIQDRAQPTGPVIGSQLVWLHQDLQGSATLVTNSAGREVGNEGGWIRDVFYDPFGRRVDADHEPLPPAHRGTIARFGYTGHEHDDEFGLIYMKGRMFDPAQRRFLTPDTIVPDPLAGQSHNRYAYVWNNPATYTDPTGHAPWLNTLLGGCAIADLWDCTKSDEKDTAKTEKSAESGEVEDPPPAPTTDDEKTGAKTVTDADAGDRHDDQPVNEPFTETFTETVETLDIRPETRVEGAMAAMAIAGTAGARTAGAAPGALKVAGGLILIAGLGVALRMLVSGSTRTITMTRTETRTRTRPAPLFHITYEMENIITGKVYSGHASGYGSPRIALDRRFNSGHHKLGPGFIQVSIDKATIATRPFADRDRDPSFWAIKGREQQLIDRQGGARSDVGLATNSANDIRAVRKSHPDGLRYHVASSFLFGQIAPYTGW